jgi:hypothetical protein
MAQVNFLFIFMLLEFWRNCVISQYSMLQYKLTINLIVESLYKGKDRDLAMDM